MTLMLAAINTAYSETINNRFLSCKAFFRLLFISNFTSDGVETGNVFKILCFNCYFLSFTGITSFSPDQTSSMAQTLMSTRPAFKASCPHNVSCNIGWHFGCLLWPARPDHATGFYGFFIFRQSYSKFPCILGEKMDKVPRNIGVIRHDNIRRKICKKVKIIIRMTDQFDDKSWFYAQFLGQGSA